VDLTRFLILRWVRIYWFYNEMCILKHYVCMSVGAENIFQFSTFWVPSGKFVLVCILNSQKQVNLCNTFHDNN